MKMRAIRTIRLCTKDCLCLFVCPTGATNTEDGQVDASKCTGCRVCVDACPSGALSLVPYDFPPQQKKSEPVIDSIRTIIKSKTKQEMIARSIAQTSNNTIMVQLAEALERSNRVMVEDMFREIGYMLPESKNTHDFLTALLENPPTDDFPKEIVEKLLQTIPCNE